MKKHSRNGKKKKLKEKADKEEERLKQRSKELRSGLVKQTGREIMLEKYENKLEEEEEGEDFDIISLLKKKKRKKIS